MRCPRCGNENPETNRFCGMCGGTLLQPSTAAAASAAPPVMAKPSSGETPVPPLRAPAAPTDPPQESPSISGPSFLGLNAPAPSPKRSDPLSINPAAAPSSRSLDYLLEDEEEPRRSGSGKVFLILIALALAVGLGYLRWKNQNFGWLGSITHKPVPAVQDSDPAASTPSPQPPSTTPASATAPAGPDATPAAPSATAGTSANPASSPAAADPNSSPAGSTPPSSTPAASTIPADSSPAPAPKPAPVDAAPKHEAPKPPPPKPVKADPVTEAQKYIYGKGVTQDCDHGLRLLKPAADSENTKAMIEMGALYSSGLCAPRDLPTAYRWFARALHKEPDNQSVQTDLQKLWGEMTQPERQLAIKLSQ